VSISSTAAYWPVRLMARRTRSGAEAGDLRAAAVGAQERGEDADGRRLAGAVGAEQREHGARLDPQVEAGQDGRVAEGLPQVLGLDCVRHIHSVRHILTAMQELPPGLDRLWSPPREQTRRRGGLSVDRIVAAAIELADADGLEAVSMARVAERLGYTAMALYRHVSGKDELLVLMQDAAVGPPPPFDESQGWREQLDRWCADLLAIFERHPWWLYIPISPPPPTPNQMAWLERGLRAFEDTNLAEGDKAAVMLMLNGLVTWEARLTAELAAEPQRVYAQVARTLVDDQRFPALGRAVSAGIFEDQSRDTDFAFSLKTVLDGVERLIHASK
jgi:AcrR family transcriptional regulator